MKRFSTLIILVIISTYLFGCVSYQTGAMRAPEAQKTPGIYHKVMPKETLWRIAKAYDVSLDAVVKANRIPDATKIEKGQLIFIPGASQVLDIDKSDTKLYSSGSFIWPVKGRVICYYGEKVSGRINKGIDIQSGSGQDIYASKNGKVTFLGELKGYGKTIIIEHNDNFSTVYANITEPKATLNSGVSQGSVIAKIAKLDKGRQSFIHFEIRKGYFSQNPMFYLP